MASPVLVAYSTKYGSTQEVAQAISATLGEYGLKTDLKSVREVRTLAGYGSVVLGAPLFMFHWHKAALRFLSRHQKTLTGMRVVLFALGPTHVPNDEKEWQDAQVHLHQDLAGYPWLKPDEVVLFGGKYDPAKLSFPLNLFIGKEPASDLRDWTAIRTWAEDLSNRLKKH